MGVERRAASRRRCYLQQACPERGWGEETSTGMFANERTGISRGWGKGTAAIPGVLLQGETPYFLRVTRSGGRRGAGIVASQLIPTWYHVMPAEQSNRDSWANISHFFAFARKPSAVAGG